jgi:hypothetical protein
LDVFQTSTQHLPFKCLIYPIMTEEGAEADFLARGRKPSKRERFRDILLKKPDKADKPKGKGVGRDEDLDDFFLKSPTEEGGDVLPQFPPPSRKPAPRINVSSLPRWPEAQSTTAGEGAPQSVEDPDETLPYRPSKPRRREGLTVSFTKTAPQIIGEGGDEAEAPTISISRTRQSSSVNPFSFDGHSQSHGGAAAVVADTTPKASSGTAINSAGAQFKPPILVRAPTGFGEARMGNDVMAAAESIKNAESELSKQGDNVARPAYQAQPDLRASGAAAGLSRKMREEEAQALTSRPRDPSPEPLAQQQNMSTPIPSQKSLSATFMPLQALKEHSPHASSNLLSPHGRSPSPSRPSSSSSHGSLTALSSGRNSPRRKPLANAPAPELKEDALSEFRSRAQRYLGLFVLAAENTEPGLHAPLPNWIRAAAWWFLNAETSFKLLRKDLTEGISIQQIMASRRYMQAIVDLAKIAWILEVIVRDHAKAEGLDLSTPESIDRLTQASPLSRLSRTLQYLQDLSNRFGSLVAAVRRSGFMASTSENQPLSPGIDSTIWITYPVLDPNVATWLRSANPSWVQMDDTMTPDEPFDLAKVIPVKNTSNTFRMRSMFCQISGGFQYRDSTPKIPCILTTARRRGSYALVIFVVSQDHSINVVLEIDSVRGDGIEWQPTVSSALFNFADGFQLLIQVQQADYMYLKESYDLAKRASTGTVRDVLENPNLRETLIFRATASTFERRSKEKIYSFPYEGEQRDCEILLFTRSEKPRDPAITHRAHRGFRLSVMLSPHAPGLSILDVHLGGDKPILLHSSHDSNSSLLELLDYRRASLLLRFQRNREFNRFYELLTSLHHSATEGHPVENVPLRSFSIDHSSSEAKAFFSAAPWRNVQITTEKAQGHPPSHNSTNPTHSAPINISAISTHGVFADRYPQGK